MLDRGLARIGLCAFAALNLAATAPVDPINPTCPKALNWSTYPLMKFTLDTSSGQRILKAEGKTILIASHDPLVYGSALADRVVEMRDGRLARG